MYNIIIVIFTIMNIIMEVNLKTLKKLFVVSNLFILSSITFVGAMESSQEEDVKQKEEKIDEKELQKFVKANKSNPAFQLLKDAGSTDEQIFNILKKKPIQQNQQKQEQDKK
jgi:hypothetical protein